MKKEFIDWTVFMGMHSVDEKRRIQAKSFFVERLEKTIYMNLEQVGKCDDVVWVFNEKIQGQYYPFMDHLHTIMNIQRIPYSNDAFNFFATHRHKGVSLMQELSYATVCSDDAVLYTFDETLLNMGFKNVQKPTGEIDKEEVFPEALEKMYQVSRALQIDI